MDKANAALARYLIERGNPLHLVTHQADAEFLGHRSVTAHVVARPAGSYFLGEFFLNRVGRAVARRLTGPGTEVRVLANGGCCRWAGVNWVHCVHHAWPCCDRGAPPWFRVKNRVAKHAARRREREAIRAARLVIANSQRTKTDLIEKLHVEPARVHTVYPGTDQAAASATERAAARRWLDLPADRPLVVFVGALGYDCNKGFDTLAAAWQRLCARPEWDADLVVAGGGNGLPAWRRRLHAAGLERRVRLLGFTEQVPELLAAADLLVSPVRYEAYGLNVQEAVCRGVPALVSAGAGVAERYPPALAPLLLPNPEDVSDLAARLLAWRPRQAEWRQVFADLAARLRCSTWSAMAGRIVELVESSLRPVAPRCLPCG
jgi:glycosyltransferase involved in cell wall biosynthesis